MRNIATRRASQQGATLVTALIMLLLLTVLAIAGAGSSILETRLANNLKFQQQAQEMAEFALRSAEARVDQDVINSNQIFALFNPANTVGFASPVLANGINSLTFDPTDTNDRSGWTDANSVRINSTNPNLGGRYVVEYIGRVGLPPLDTEDVDRRQYAFRITAIGYSLEGEQIGSASYLLQSTFTKPLAGTGAL